MITLIFILTLPAARVLAAPAEPARPRAGAGPRVAAEKAGIQWVRIPGGSFMMGASGLAGPVHRVSVKAFRLAKTEVTNRQYRACVSAGACTPPESYWGGDDHPVVNVSWYQAVKFSEWVDARLPTEAEWEYAARSAGKNYKYPWGNEAATCKRAVIADKVDVDGCGKDSTWPVCSKPAGNTAQGLCDMAGNAAEWTQDLEHSSYEGAPIDGSAWEGRGSSYARVCRGGAWRLQAPLDRGQPPRADVESTLRQFEQPAFQYIYLGFRPAR